MDIIVDIDGTLSDPEHRLDLIKEPPPKWEEFFDAAYKDKPNQVLCDLVSQLMGEANRIFFVTGRPERIRDDTQKWLSGHLDCSINDFILMMRKDGDHRKDDLIKNEMLQAIRQMGYKPVLVIEDRARVVEMYRAEGLVVLQCAEGMY